MLPFDQGAQAQSRIGPGLCGVGWRHRIERDLPLGRDNFIPSDFATAAHGGTLPWRESAALAFELASTRGTSYGSEIMTQNDGGLYFLSNALGADPLFRLYRSDVAAPGIVPGYIRNNQNRYFAHATLLAAPVPRKLTARQTVLFDGAHPGSSFSFVGGRFGRQALGVTPQCLANATKRG